MKSFLAGVLVSFAIFGCSPNPLHTVRSVDSGTRTGYEIELIDRNNNGQIDLIRTYLVCEGVRFKTPIVEKDILERRINISAGYYHRSDYYMEQKDFKTNITWNYPYKECEILNR